MDYIDLRSDTVTLPTDEMRNAIFKAEVGDDVYGEDPTINKLEKMTADLFQKEDAMFVTSGTQGNQLSVMTHTNPGDEIILEQNSHIVTSEVGGLGYLSGVQARLISGDKGAMNPLDIEAAIRDKEDIHQPETGLICIENTHNSAGGTVVPMDILEETYKLAKKYNIPVHMDGARIFNAATFLNVPVKDIAQYADSIMFCLSKGLCAPVGSMVVGSKEFIKRARKFRKMLGGGLRQAGFLAAAGIIAIEKMTKRLQEDHDNARFLAEGLSEIHGIKVDLDTVQTNIVMCNIEELGMNAYEFSRNLSKNNIKVNGGPGYKVRFVTHYWITKEDIHKTLDVIKTLA